MAIICRFSALIIVIFFKENRKIKEAEILYGYLANRLQSFIEIASAIKT